MRLRAKGGVVVTVSKLDRLLAIMIRVQVRGGIDRTEGMRQTHGTKAGKSQRPRERDSKKSKSPGLH